MNMRLILNYHEFLFEKKKTSTNKKSEPNLEMTKSDVAIFKETLNKIKEYIKMVDDLHDNKSLNTFKKNNIKRELSSITQDLQNLKKSESNNNKYATIFTTKLVTVVSPYLTAYKIRKFADDKLDKKTINKTEFNAIDKKLKEREKILNKFIEDVKKIDTSKDDDYEKITDMEKQISSNVETIENKYNYDGVYSYKHKKDKISKIFYDIDKIANKVKVSKIPKNEALAFLENCLGIYELTLKYYKLKASINDSFESYVKQQTDKIKDIKIDIKTISKIESGDGKPSDLETKLEELKKLIETRKQIEKDAENSKTDKKQVQMYNKLRSFYLKNKKKLIEYYALDKCKKENDFSKIEEYKEDFEEIFDDKIEDIEQDIEYIEDNIEKSEYYDDEDHYV